jgi:4-carboxymuconolactone decarboxylase
MRVQFGQVGAEERERRKAEGTTPPNLQLALANAPDVARFQLDLLRSIQAGLPLRLRELVVLEEARLVGNAYCWGHHVPLALEAGFTEEQVRALRDGDRSAFDAGDCEILDFVAAVEGRKVTDELWETLSYRFTDNELVHLSMLVGFYAMVSRVQDALDAPQDPGFGGFEVP